MRSGADTIVFQLWVVCLKEICQRIQVMLDEFHSLHRQQVGFVAVEAMPVSARAFSETE